MMIEAWEDDDHDYSCFLTKNIYIANYFIYKAEKKEDRQWRANIRVTFPLLCNGFRLCFYHVCS